MAALGIEDLSVLGLGLDLTGALILGVGLWSSVTLIARSATIGGLGLEPVDRAYSRVDGTIGVSILVVGFAVQFVAYLLGLAYGGRVESDHGVWSAVTAGAFAVAGGVLCAAWWWTVREKWTVRLLIAAATVHPEPGRKVPSAGRLIGFGEPLDHDLRLYDSWDEYCRGAWGVKAFYLEADERSWEAHREQYEIDRRARDAGTLPEDDGTVRFPLHR